jgi:Protein of unknown function (DUF2637)
VTSWKPIGYGGAGFAVAVSLWANTTHAWEHTPAGQSHWAAAFIAAVPPICLAVSAEIVARKPWPKKHAGAVITMAVTVGLAVAAFVLSYAALYGMFHDLGWTNPKLTALGPLTVDGLMVAALVALVVPDAEPTRSPSDTDTTAQDRDKPTDTDTTRQDPPPPKPTARRRVNGTDLRVVEVAELIAAARAGGEREPSVNAVAKHYGIKWEQAKPIHAAAVATLEEHP